MCQVYFIILCHRLLSLLNDFSWDTISFFLPACPSARICLEISSRISFLERYPPANATSDLLHSPASTSLVGALARVHLSPRVRSCSFTDSFSTIVSALSARAQPATHLAAKSRNDDGDDDNNDDDDTPHCSRLRCGHDQQQKRFPRARTRGASSFAAGAKTRENLRCPLGGCGSGEWSSTGCVCRPRTVRTVVWYRVRGASSTTNLNDSASAARRSCTEVPLRLPPPCPRGVTKIARGR